MRENEALRTGGAGGGVFFNGRSGTGRLAKDREQRDVKPTGAVLCFLPFLYVHSCDLRESQWSRELLANSYPPQVPMRSSSIHRGF